MPKEQLPILKIDQFGHDHENISIYANKLPAHLKEHHFIHTAHKHDFYLTVLFTKGKGTHEIDFISYDVKPGSVFLMKPGQTHNWKLSKDIDGYVFFHSAEFYNLHFHSHYLHDYPFFSSFQNTPLLHIKKKRQKGMENLFHTILEEYKSEKILREQKILLLISEIYVEVTRDYVPTKSNQASQIYLSTYTEFEKLVDEKYKHLKSPKEYASVLNITERHLNRICKSCMNKTSTDIITDRVVLEAKRLLVSADLSVSEIAAELGYFDNSYFTRLFKLKTKETPVIFRKRTKFGN